MVFIVTRCCFRIAHIILNLTKYKNTKLPESEKKAKNSGIDGYFKSVRQRSIDGHF